MRAVDGGRSQWPAPSQRESSCLNPSTGSLASHTEPTTAKPLNPISLACPMFSGVRPPRASSGQHPFWVLQRSAMTAYSSGVRWWRMRYGVQNWRGLCRNGRSGLSECPAASFSGGGGMSAGAAHPVCTRAQALALHGRQFLNGVPQGNALPTRRVGHGTNPACAGGNA